MSDQPATDLFTQINELKSEIRTKLMPEVREAQAVFTEAVKNLLRACGRLDDATLKLLTPVIDETEANGTGIVGRRKRSTTLEAPSGEDAPAKPKKERQVRELSGELVEPGSGKRGCSNCKRTGHRAKNCPNPPYEG